MVRTKLALAALIIATTVSAQDQPPAPVTGWWRATLTHKGESRDIWLHIEDHDGKLLARFSNPLIGIDDAPLSRVTVGPGRVELTSLGWSLRRENDGSLTGIVPDALVAVYRLNARFVRSAEPPRPPTATPSRAPPVPVWQRDVGSAVYGGLAFDAGRKLVIVATDSGKLLALHGDSGKPEWSIDAGAPIRATPVVAGSALYVATDQALLKLNAASGRRIWSAELGEAKAKRLDASDPNFRGDHYSSSAVVAGNTIFVGSRDGCIHRLSAASGKLLTRYCATDIVTATPVVDGERLYFASFDKNVYSADIGNGRMVWKHDMRGAVPRDLALAAGKILAGSRSFDLTALDESTGRPVWNRYYWYSWVDSVPNVVGRTIYIGASDSLRVFAFDTASGKKLWESRVPGWTWARPAVGRTAVYASVTGTSTPYSGARAGGFAAIDKANGKLRWLIASDRPEKAPVYGFASAPVVANGMVYAADLTGKVMAFRDR